jgi:predicted MPP superfamily phosphohydrolase
VILSVLGNHDYWTNPEVIKEVLKKSNIINLENEIYTICRGDKKLQIAGADCVTEGYDDIEKIKEHLNKDYPAIMLVHEPDFADTTCEIETFILQLSGHSHGGQISIPKIRTPIRGKNFRKYPSGKYKIENMIQYTNRGIGTNMFWFRINCPPEITVITLKRVE